MPSKPLSIFTHKQRHSTSFCRPFLRLLFPIAIINIPVFKQKLRCQCIILNIPSFNGVWLKSN